MKKEFDIDTFIDNLKNVDLRKAVIFPELSGLVISVNDVLDIVHQVTDKGMMSKEFIENNFYNSKNDSVKAFCEGYNRGLSSADIVIRQHILMRFKKR